MHTYTHTYAHAHAHTHTHTHTHTHVHTHTVLFFYMLHNPSDYNVVWSIAVIGSCGTNTRPQNEIRGIVCVGSPTLLVITVHRV